MLIPALLAGVTVAAFSAAVWQWQRIEYHTLLAQSANTSNFTLRQLNAEPNRSAPDLAKSPSPNQHLSNAVQVSGHWLPDSTVYISPRLMDGRLGAWAVSVLRYQDASGAPRYLAVQRGWAAQSQPMHAPNIAGLTAAAQTLEGQLVDALPKVYALQTVPPSALGLWQNHDLNHHGAALGIILQPQVLVLSTSSPDAEAQQLRRIPAQQAVDALLDKANKNRGYALQWLGLGCVGVFGLLWMWRQHRAVKPSSTSTSTNHLAP